MDMMRERVLLDRQRLEQETRQNDILENLLTELARITQENIIAELARIRSLQVGDINGDGKVDTEDINPFLQLLVNP
jgi:hypothetical protein